MLGFLKQISGWLLKINSVPYNRLIKGHTVSGSTDWTDKAYVDTLVNTDVSNSIAALMARMGMVIVPTNIALSGFPTPISVNGRNYTLVSKQRVLLIGQTTSSENGIYEVVDSNLLRLNDYEALNGIYFNSNQIGVSRWNDVLNALRFNVSGQLQVRVKNSGTNVFTGMQVDSTTGEIWIDLTTMPGYGSGLIVESLLVALGSTLKLNFDNNFTLTYDGGNARSTVSLNKNLATNILEDFVHSSNLPSGGQTLPKSGVVLYANNNTANIQFAEYYGAFPSETTAYPAVVGFLYRQVDTSANAQIYAIYVNSASLILLATRTYEWVESLRFVQGAIPVNAGYINFNTGFMSFADIVSVSQYVSNGVYFRLTQAENGAKLQAVSAKASVNTVVDTGITIVSTQYYKLKVVWNGTQALFYNGNTLLATITTNLPIVSVMPASKLNKVAPATAAVYQILTDYVDFKYERI